MATLRDDVSAVPILLPVGMAPSLYRVRLGLPSEQWQAEAENHSSTCSWDQPENVISRMLRSFYGNGVSAGFVGRADERRPIPTLMWMI